jgi:hypothetical protein
VSLLRPQKGLKFITNCRLTATCSTTDFENLKNSKQAPLQAIGFVVEFDVIAFLRQSDMWLLSPCRVAALSTAGRPILH